MAFSVNIQSYDAGSGLITMAYNDAPSGSTIEFSCLGIKARGPGNTLSIPSYQRNGYTFTIIGYAGGQTAQTTLTTQTGVSIGGNNPATPTPAPTSPTTPTPAPTGAGLTGETKYGFRDGDQIGFWGSYSPVFARVVGGKLYGIYIEKDPAQSSSGLYNLPVKKIRAWMNHVYGDDNIAAAYFEELPNQDNQPEPGVTDGSFVITMTVGQAARRPVASGTPTPGAGTPTTPGTATPGTPTPGTGTPPTPGTATPTAPAVVQPFLPTTPTTDPATTPATTKTTMYVLIGIGVLVVGLIIAAFTVGKK